MQRDIQFLREKISLLIRYIPRGDPDLARMLDVLKAMEDATSARELGYLDTEVDRQAKYHREMTPEFGKTGYRAFYSKLRATQGRARVRESERVIASRALKKGTISDEHEARAVHALLSGDFHDRATPSSVTVERYQRLISDYERMKKA